MACHLFGDKPLSETMLGYWQSDPNFSEILFIHENASENIVFEIAAILSWRKWVKGTSLARCIHQGLVTHTCVNELGRSLLVRVIAFHLFGFAQEYISVKILNWDANNVI